MKTNGEVKELGEKGLHSRLPDMKTKFKEIYERTITNCEWGKQFSGVSWYNLKNYSGIRIKKDLVRKERFRDFKLTTNIYLFIMFQLAHQSQLMLKHHIVTLLTINN